MHTPNFLLSSTTICKVKSIPISRGYTRLLWLSNENIGRSIQAYGLYSIRGETFSFKGFNGRWWLISRVKMPRERAAGTTPHAISEYRSSRMTDNARVAEERKWEVAKERGVRGGRGGETDWRQRVKRRIQWCPCPRATRSIRPFVHSLARQQHHHKTSLSSGNFSGIVTVNNVHLTFSFSLPHIVSPPYRSLFQS